MECPVCTSSIRSRFCKECGKDSNQTGNLNAPGMNELREAYRCLPATATLNRAEQMFAAAVHANLSFEPALEAVTWLEYGLTICRASGGGPLRKLSTPRLTEFVRVLREAGQRYDRLPSDLKDGIREKDVKGSISFNLNEAARVLAERGTEASAPNTGSEGTSPAPSKWDYAEPAFGPGAFEGRLKLHINVPHTQESLIPAEDYGIGCVNCKAANPIPVCPNCGSTKYRFGLDTRGLVGLFCAQCRQGFTQRRCPDCGAFSPITHETLIRPTKPPSEGKSGGCFIATAACGDPYAPEVIVLSVFRDEFLAVRPFGRAFIRAYYALSPAVAAVVVRSNAIRRATMVILVRPAARFAARFAARLSGKHSDL